MSESGHATNLAHFDNLISAVQSFGTRYAPSASSLSLASLQTLHSATATSIDGLNDSVKASKIAQTDRDALFTPLDTLTRRILASAKSAEATDAQLAAMDTIARKIKGERAGTKNPDPVNPGDPKSISVSQQSFVNLAAHFKSLVSMLGALPTYNPNEGDLKISSLQALQTAMANANHTAGAAELAETAARDTRNKNMYAPKTGLVAIAALVKSYVFSSSNLGAKNPDYKTVKGISFSPMKD